MIIIIGTVKIHLRDLRRKEKNAFLDKQALGHTFLLWMTAVRFMVYYSKASFQTGVLWNFELFRFTWVYHLQLFSLFSAQGIRGNQITSVSSAVLYPFCNNIISTYIPTSLQVMWLFWKEQWCSWPFWSYFLSDFPGRSVGVISELVGHPLFLPAGYWRVKTTDS